MTGGPPAPVPFGDGLYRRLHGFLLRVRGAGVSVGVGSERAFLDGLREVGLLDRAAVREVARVTLAKSPRDVTDVDRAFDEYWADPEGAGEPTLAERTLLQRPPTGRGTSGAPAGRPDTARSEPPSPDRELRAGRYSPEAPSAAHLLVPAGDRELRSALAGARRFRRAMATRPGRRFRPSPRGAVDPRTTARRSVRSGGEWVRLFRRRPVAGRADLVVLWDVSGSMREHLSRLFALVYALKRVNRSTRVFAFGTSIAEVTGAIASRPYRRAVRAVEPLLDPRGGGTQIAQCLAAFRRNWGAELRPTTSVVIVSDGWEFEGGRRLAAEMAALWSRCHRVVWVNPYAADPSFSPATEGLVEARPWIDLLTSPVDFPRPRGGGRAPARPRPA